LWITKTAIFFIADFIPYSSSAFVVEEVSKFSVKYRRKVPAKPLITQPGRPANTAKAQYNRP
jgi:hypothetical protein